MLLQVSGVMRGLLRNIPPYKWLLVLPQLTSRICHPQQVSGWLCLCWLVFAKFI